jgi:hypothetical protein
MQQWKEYRSMPGRWAFEERLTTARAIFGVFPCAIFGAANVPLAKSGSRLLEFGEWRMENGKWRLGGPLQN